MIKSITIIIPIYGDLPSIVECIESVRKYVDREHKVILVNDCGSEADSIEESIKPTIEDWSNFQYFRNEKNLGFVRNCNHSVFNLDKTDNDILLLNSDAVVTEGFLDEMIAVLYSSKKIAAVSPRTNNATIASVPIRLDEITDYTAEYSREVFEAVQSHIPRYTVTPVAHGFCMLLRREVINKYGLFDEIFGRGYGEENDFCLRIGKHGYESVFANHAYVFHARSKSFTPQVRTELIKVNRKILEERYPYLDEMMHKYIYQDMSLVDWFAELFAKNYLIKKIAIDLTHMPQDKESNAVKRVLGLLKFLKSTNQTQQYEYVIMTNPDVDEFYRFEQYDLRIMYAWENDERFDVGFSPYAVTYNNNLISLHRHCLRIVILGNGDRRHFTTGGSAEKASRVIADVCMKQGVGNSDISRLLEEWTTRRVEKKHLDSRQSIMVKFYKSIDYFKPI